jgi:hypothetical protein
MAYTSKVMKYRKARKSNKKGKQMRDSSCINENKSLCCYLCKLQGSCEISCNFLENISEINGAIDPSTTIEAFKIVYEPTIVDQINGKYTMLFDFSLVGDKFDNLIKAINVMADKGWKCVNTTSFNQAGTIFSTKNLMYALMEKASPK